MNILTILMDLPTQEHGVNFNLFVSFDRDCIKSLISLGNMNILAIFMDLPTQEHGANFHLFLSYSIYFTSNV